MWFFSYILRVQFDQEDTNGIIYLWVGSKADPEDIKLAEEISDEMFNDVTIFFIIISCSCPLFEIIKCLYYKLLCLQHIN